MERAIAHDISRGERTTDVRLKEIAPFSKWLLSKGLKKGLEKAGFRFPTVIQASAIPIGKSGLDLLVQSKSGTGKTLIFCAVLLEVCHDAPGLHSIILTPTREIAIQIETVLQQIGQFCKDYQVVNTIGGTDIAIDRKRLQNARTVVGTPGRLVHLIQSDILKTTDIRLIVLDEADQLYSSSHRKNLETILNAIPTQRQIIACSATFCNKLDEELAKVMRNPLLISSKDQVTALLGIKQYQYELAEQKTSVLEMEAKVAAIVNIFKRVSFKLCMIFAGSQSRAESYSCYLNNSGWECELISGGQKQTKRNEVFKKFQNFQTRILVTTDLMARGVDSEHVNLVINVEPPRDMVTYLHRIGRAGRFGSHGIAITFVSSKNDSTLFEKILSEIGCGMNILEFPKKANDGEEENFWEPSTFKTELQEEKTAEIAESMFDVLRAKENVLSFKDQTRIPIEVQSICDSNASLDTKTFCIDSKDSAVNILPALVVENKENLLLLQAEDTPTSNRSSVQLSANTIDDASSIAADSVFSSQLELQAPHPSLALDNAKNFDFCNYGSSELKEIKREQILKTDLFMDYRTNVLEDAEACNQSEAELETKVESIEDFSHTQEEDIRLHVYYDDMFADYTNFICRNNEELKDLPELTTSNTVNETSNEKDVSMLVNISSLNIASEHNDTNGYLEQEKDSEIASDERMTDSQTYLQNTICASNGSYSADSEPSMELKTKDELARNQCAESEFYFGETLSKSKDVSNQEAKYEELEDESEYNDHKDDQDTFTENTLKTGEKLTRIHELWMNEYWRQVNFIEAYVKFALDYRKQCEND